MYFLRGILLLAGAGKVNMSEVGNLSTKMPSGYSSKKRKIYVPLVLKTHESSSDSASIVAENSLLLRMEQRYQARL